MGISIKSLIAAHREIEAALEPVGVSVASGNLDVTAFRAAHELCRASYQVEESFLELLSTRDATLAAKLRGQHAEALELAEHLVETLAANHPRDAMYLARRFLAIVQHNIIEEERDVFPTMA